MSHVMSWLRDLGVSAGSKLIFAGTFHCLADPTWQDRMQDARSRGYYVGLPSWTWGGLASIGVERRG